MSAQELARVPVAAVSFLTRLPVGRFVAVDDRDIARAAPMFPLVGGAVGGAAGLTADLLTGPLPSLPAAAIGVGVAALLTGAMHLRSERSERQLWSSSCWSTQEPLRG
jgi:cobalamin synthase